MGMTSVGLNEAHIRLQARIKRIRNLQQPNAVIAQHITKLAKQSFERQASPIGRRWAPLAASTLAARKPGEGRTPLVKTRQLSRTVRAFATSSNTIRVLFKDYGRFHTRTRNFLPFEKDGSGRARPIPQLDQFIRHTYILWISAGRASRDVPLAAE